MVIATAVLGAAVLALPGCASSGDGETGAGSATPSAGQTSHPFLPGLTAFPHVPEGVTIAPVVVLVPGGSWETADPSGLAPLADALAARGVLAVPVVVRAAADDAVCTPRRSRTSCAPWPTPRRRRAPKASIPTTSVVLGHSSGAHLAALAALDADGLSPDCEDPVVAPEALVGLAGPYDIREVLGCRLGTPRPGGRPRGVGRRPTPCCSPHDGQSCRSSCSTARTTTSYPPDFSTDFAAALRGGGRPTTLTIVPDEDHDGIYTAQVAAGPVAVVDGRPALRPGTRSATAP